MRNRRIQSSLLIWMCLLLIVAGAAVMTLSADAFAQETVSNSSTAGHDPNVLRVTFGPKESQEPAPPVEENVATPVPEQSDPKQPVATPEPASFGLVGLGIGGLLCLRALRHRRKRSRQ